MDGLGTLLLAIVAFAGVAFVLMQANPQGGPPAAVQKIALAIASAEGFYKSGSRPQRNHNPGDMTRDLVGRAVGTDGPFQVYATDADGWADLYRQIELWLSGESNNADSSSTIEDLSGFYTTTEKTSWAVNVANALNVSIDTPIGEIS